MKSLQATIAKHTLRITAALAFGALAALAPAANAQVVVEIGVQPVCQYGYYDYQPYSCAPMGFYGSGYFYNGIFLGVGPWSNWGYGHGWGGHRFSGDGGGRYHGGGYNNRNNSSHSRPDYRGNKPNAGSPRPPAPRGGSGHPSGGNRPSGGGGRPSGGGHPPSGGGGHPHDDTKP